jgi:3-oxoacyl-[acyl-carrier-protein] synthase II
LALCAVHRALGLPAGSRLTGPPDPHTAVVASSNLGNAASVVEVVRAVRAGGRREVSPLAAPNASSNVLASTLAIWFRFGGPNVMVCSGATAGLDAVAVGVLLLRARRAARVVVAGAEPADEVALALHQQRAAGAGQLRAGAACVILTAADQVPDAPRLVSVDSGLTRPASVPTDITGSGGTDLYGAQGVALLAVAAEHVRRGGGEARVICGDDTDGWRSAVVSPPAGLGR